MRLDLLLVSRGDFKSRDRAKEAVKGGRCSVNGKVVSKPAFDVDETSEVTVVGADIPFVSRGGVKLEAALDEFGIVVAGKVALDIGVATGGFTDCLLQQGARFVYAVDIGKGQLAEELLKDVRVKFRAETDARDLESDMFDGRIDLIVVDVSFISVLMILPALKKVAVSGDTDFIFLIKPQFEFGKKHSGVLKDQKEVLKILEGVRSGFIDLGFNVLKEMDSPISGKEGNREFLWHVRLF